MGEWVWIVDLGVIWGGGWSEVVTLDVAGNTGSSSGGGGVFIDVWEGGVWVQDNDTEILFSDLWISTDGEVDVSLLEPEWSSLGLGVLVLDSEESGVWETLWESVDLEVNFVGVDFLGGGLWISGDFISSARGWDWGFTSWETEGFLDEEWSSGDANFNSGIVDWALWLVGGGCWVNWEWLDVVEIGVPVEGWETFVLGVLVGGFLGFSFGSENWDDEEESDGVVIDGGEGEGEGFEDFVVSLGWGGDWDDSLLSVGGGDGVGSEGDGHRGNWDIITNFTERVSLFAGAVSWEFSAAFSEIFGGWVAFFDFFAVFVFDVAFNFFLTEGDGLDDSEGGWAEVQVFLDEFLDFSLWTFSGEESGGLSVSVGNIWVVFLGVDVVGQDVFSNRFVEEEDVASGPGWVDLPGTSTVEGGSSDGLGAIITVAFGWEVSTSWDWETVVFTEEAKWDWLDLGGSVDTGVEDWVDHIVDTVVGDLWKGVEGGGVDGETWGTIGWWDGWEGEEGQEEIDNDEDQLETEACVFPESAEDGFISWEDGEDETCTGREAEDKDEEETPDGELDEWFKDGAGEVFAAGDVEASLSVVSFSW